MFMNAFKQLTVKYTHETHTPEHIPPFTARTEIRLHCVMMRNLVDYA